MVTNYNKTWHSSIKMTPSEASLKKNEAAVDSNLYADHDRQSSKPKFTSGSAMAEGPCDVLVSRNSATIKHRYRVALFA